MVIKVENRNFNNKCPDCVESEAPKRYSIYYPASERKFDITGVFRCVYGGEKHGLLPCIFMEKEKVVILDPRATIQDNGEKKYSGFMYLNLISKTMRESLLELEDYYSSEEWQEEREMVLGIWDGNCERCQEPVKSPHVHHVRGLAYREYEVLCKHCHAEHHDDESILEYGHD